MADEMGIANPLQHVRVGSCYFDDTRSFIADPVLDESDPKKMWLTALNTEFYSTGFMSGNSEFVTSSHMNQGSFSLSGSYGLSGMSKVSGAVTGYIGNSSANESQTISVNLNFIKYSSVQYIDFASCLPADLVLGLKKEVQDDVLDVLEKYEALFKPEAPSEGTDAWKKICDLWSQSANVFYNKWGAGVVVGVVWGGWGYIHFEYKKNSSDNKWEGGGSAKFSYEGEGAAATVAATYGHSEDAADKQQTVQTTFIVMGDCVENEIKNYNDSLNNSALDKLGNVDVHTAPPLNDSPSEIKDFPSFSHPPDENEVLKKRIENIKLTDELNDTLAKKAAYDKWAKDNPGKTIKDFEDSANKKTDLTKIPDSGVVDDLLEGSSNAGEKISIRSPAADLGLLKKQADSVPMAAENLVAAAAANGPIDTTKYVPLGAWILPWGKIFPWLVSGQQNQPTDTDQKALNDVLKLRTMQQDFLTLTRVYQLIGEKNPTFYDQTSDGSMVLVQFANLANEFANAAYNVSELLNSKGLGGSTSGKLQSEIKTPADIIKGLGSDAANIYDKWTSIPLLRQCELGAGLVIYAHGGDGDKWQTPLTVRRVDHVGLVYGTRTNFAFANRNFVEFSNTLKCWPFILPYSGRIAAFGYYGDKIGFLSANEDRGLNELVGFGTCLRWPDGKLDFEYLYRKCQFTKDIGSFPWTQAIYIVPAVDQAIYFTPTKEKDCLEGWSAERGIPFLFDMDSGAVERSFAEAAEAEKSNIETVEPPYDPGYPVVLRLYPIPFTAAQGLGDDSDSAWYGPAMAVGNGDLPEVIKRLKGELEILSAWTFDSDWWKDKSITSPYSNSAMKPSYVGLVDEPKNIYLK